MTLSPSPQRRASLVAAIGLLAIALAVPVAGASGPVGDAVGAQADDSDADRTVAVDDLTAAWHGETIAITGFEAGETVEFTADDGVAQVTADETGTAVLDTSALDVGEWSVTRADGDVAATFSVHEDIFFTFDVSHTESGTILSVDSNRHGYEVALRADGVDAETLATAVQRGTVEDDAVVLEVESSSRTVGVDPSALPAGTHELTGTITDTGTSATATFAVERDLDSVDREVAVDESVTPVWQGSVLRVVGFEPGDVVSLSHEDDVRQRVADDDGAVTVDTTGWATGDWTAASENGEESLTFAVRSQVFHEVAFAPAEADDTTALEVDSNRRDYEVAVDAAGLDARQLDAAVEGGWVEDGQFYLEVPATDASHDVDATAIPAGEYAFDLAVVDADVIASATLNVTSDLRFGENEPQPYVGSEHHLDFTGDGELGPRDVGTFFEYAHLSTAQAYPEYFDYSGNGRVSHGDVVTLFQFVFEDGPAGEVEFDGGPFPVAEGDVAEIDVATEGTDDAWVTVEHSQLDGYAWVHLTDVDDGTATLQLNTYELSHAPAIEVFDAEGASVADAGYADVAEALTPHIGDVGDDRYPAGFSFTIRAYSEDPTADDVRADDRSRLILDELETEDVTIGVVPGDAVPDEVDEPEDLLANASQSDVVARGDVVFAEIEASGIYGYTGETVDDFAAEDVRVSLYQELEGTFGGTERNSENLSESGSVLNEHADLVVDEDEERLFVAVPADVIGPMQPWEFRIDVGEDNPYTNEAQTASAQFAVKERSVSLQGPTAFDDRLVVEPDQNAEIVAETNVAPGTEGEFFVELRDATLSKDVTVDEHGDAVATFDFGDREAGELVETIEFAESGGEYDATAGIFGDPAAADAPVTVSADGPENVEVGEAATVDVTVENEGDQPVETLLVGAGESVYSAESLELDAGETWTSSYDLERDEPGLLEWTVEVPTDHAEGTVVVSDPAAYLEEAAVGGVAGETQEVAIEAVDDPDDVWVLARYEGYAATVRLSDVDEDGATLRWDTGSLDDETAGFAADGATAELVDVDAAADRNASLAPGSGTLQTYTSDPSVGAVSDDEAELVLTDDEPDVVGAHRGDPLEVTHLEPGTDATVTIEALDGDYAATAEVTPPLRGADPLSVGWNTFEATNASAAAGVLAAPGTVEFVDLQGADAPIVEPGQYEATIERDGEVVDEVRVVLTERPEPEARTLVAPGSVDLEDVTLAHELLPETTPRTTVAEGDLAVVEVRAPGLYGAIGDEVSSLTVVSSGVALDRVVRSPFDTQRDPITDVGDDVALVPGKDRILVAFEATSDAAGEIQFTAEDDLPHVDEPETASSSLDVAERSLRIVGERDQQDRLLVPASEQGEIVARTNVAPGTSADVYVVGKDFTWSQDSIVDEDGRVVGTFNFSKPSAGEVVESMEVTEFGGREVSTSTGVFVEGSQPSFVATGDAPQIADVDSDAELAATVVNEGDAAGEVPITVEVAGTTEFSSTVELVPGGEWYVTFDLPTDEVGDVDWRVEAGDDVEEGTLSVREPPT